MIDAIEVPSIDWVALLPLTSLLFGALLLLATSALVPGRLVARLAAPFTLVVCAVSLGASVFVWRRLGEGTAPFADVADAVAIDRFGVFVAAVIAMAIALSTLLAQSDRSLQRLGNIELYALFLLSGSGGVMLAMANDLVVLFLGLEILSIALYVLAGYDVRRRESREAGLKYFVLGGFASAFLLYGIALLYGATGSTNLGQIGSFLAANLPSHQGLLLAGLALLIVGLAFKVAAVPFHSWAPDVYDGSPTPVTAFMASAAKAAAFAGMLRVLFTTFPTLADQWRPVIWVLAVGSLVVGAFLAIAQDDVKRMLAYSSISQAGFILLGVEAGSSFGVSSALFYLLAYTFMVAGSFAVVAIVAGGGGRPRPADEGRVPQHRLSAFRGLSARRPTLAFGFTVLLLAQAGVPFTSGFVAKFGVLGAAVGADSYALAIVAMLTAVVSAYMYLRIVLTMYLVAPDPGAPRVSIPAMAGAGLVVAVAVTIVLGVVPGPALSLARDAVPTLLGAG